MAHPVLAGLILVPAEMGMKASSYPAWKVGLEEPWEVMAAGTELGRAWISTDNPATGITPIQCIIIAWKPLLLLA